MSLYDSLQIVVLFGVLITLTPLLGEYLAKVFTSQPTFMQACLGPLEQFFYRAGQIDANEEMTSVTYAKHLLLFNFIGFLSLFFLQIFQGYLPFNPEQLPATSWDLAFNTSMSFVTNTNWQAYSGETTLSYFTQMLGLTVQNFLSAATGIAVLLALTRGLIRKTADTIGNFWVDLVRSVLYVLLPLSFVLAILLVNEGVIQTLSPYVAVQTLENQSQTIPLGPAASQIAIKQLGTNGGGFFGANGTHPFENPSALSNFLQTLSLLLIPAALIYAYGVLVGSRKHGWLIFTAVFSFVILEIILGIYFQRDINPSFNAYPILEGQETRFGTSNSVLWTLATTATANGSVNAMVSSLNPLVSGFALVNMMAGELFFGGVGVGMCSLLMYIILTVFLCGLMVGRTPEYLGKKIEKNEIKWVILAILLPGILILIGSGVSSVLPIALSSLGNQGPHGLTEILYAFSSAVANNGSAFAGLKADVPYYNIVLGFAMLAGRLSIIIPCLALAGLFAKKRFIPLSSGTLSTNNFLFFILLISVIVLEGALSFFPAFTLGPLVEHLLMLKGTLF